MHVQSYTDGLLDVRWRGATLSRFDGRRWDNPPPEQETLEPVEHGVAIANKSYYKASTRPGHKLQYTVQFSDVASDTLFIAGTPGTISINVPFVRFVWSSGSYRIPPPPRGEKVTYGVYSFLEDETAPIQSTPEPLSPRDRIQLLQLPAGLDPRIPRLSRQVTTGGLTEIEKARQIETHLRTNYGYTLQLLPKAVPDPIANFLFDRKRGHCEYFASAMAIMLRTVGVPSRVVTGFQSGVYNPLTKQQIVRASDAHSWVEAWIAGRGWTTFDPTPPDPAASGASVMARLSLFFDAAQEFWQDWVVSYDLDRQIVLASNMDVAARRFRFRSFDPLRAWLAETFVRLMRYASALAIAAGAGVILVLFGPSIAAWWKARQRVKRLVRGEGVASDATLLYERMLALLARRGIQKPPWLTPAEFARVLPATEVRTVVHDLTSFYNEFRFGGHREVAPQMMHLLEQLEKGKI
jgi:transglutaminase-like putative cysteine protease